jgi:hypothetical protein
MSLAPPDPASANADLVRALVRLLRPLVRLLLRRGVTFPAFTDLVREIYLDVARNDLLPEPRARTDSRISLLTGIHRKEVRRQRDRPAQQGVAETPALSLSSLVIARWLASPPWIDAAGAPRPLPRTAAEGAPSFDALVGSVTRDVRPRAVLDEWLRQGIAQQDADGHIVLSATAYLPPPGGAEQLFYFARNLHDHIAAAAANIGASGRAPFLDRSVHYDRMTPAAAAELEEYARRAAERLLIEVNREANRLVEAGEPLPGTPARRVNLGVFLYGEEEPPGEEAAP